MADRLLNVIFTGVVTFKPKQYKTGGRFEKVRCVMPNGRQWTESRKIKGAVITPHKPFIIASEKEAMEDQGDWYGRAPDGRIGRRWVYWILQDENIRIRGGEEDGVEWDKNMDALVSISSLSTDADISDKHADEDTPEVAARVILNSGRISVTSLTECFYRFETAAGKTKDMRIGDEVTAAIRLKKKRDGRVRFKSVPFGAVAKPDIILHMDGNISTVFVGNAPEVDLPAVVGIASNHEHGNENLHWELYYRVSKKAPEGVIPVPERRNALQVSRGPLPGSDGCPSNRP